MSENKGLPEELLGTAQETEQAEPGPEAMSPQDVIEAIMSNLSSLAMVQVHIQTEIEALQKNVAYLLSKDTEYMERLNKMIGDLESGDLSVVKSAIENSAGVTDETQK